MAYLGNAPARSFISFERQVFTIVNSQTVYTLDHSVTNENDIRLVVNNVVQEPGSGKAYTATGTTLTLSAALTNGTDEMYCVFLGRATATNAPGAGSVGTSQLASDAVTNAKIADDAISDEQLDPTAITGQTAETTVADDDLVLLSDTSASAALKKMTVANLTANAGLDGWSSNSGNLLPADASKGIYLGVNSATAANLLNDYEEGTWTLTVTGQTTDTNQVSKYTKIGNRVFIDSFFTCDTDVSATNESQPMQGLPFSAGTSTRAIINLKFIKTSAVAGYGGAPTLGSSSAISLETYNSNFLIKPISTTETNTSLYYRQDIFRNGTLIRLTGSYETTA